MRGKKSPVSQARGAICLRGKRTAEGRRCEDEAATCHGKMRDLTVHEPDWVIAKRAKAAQVQQEKQKQERENQQQQVCASYATSGCCLSIPLCEPEFTATPMRHMSALAQC